MQQLRRLFTAILMFLGAVTVIPAFSGIASAHHSNISASVACTGTVSWTASSWSTGAQGTNPDIRVTLKVGSTTTQIAQGAFNAGNNYQFSGTFGWPSGANSIVVSSVVVGTWANGNTSKTGSSVTVYKPTNCPAQPGASKAVSCTNTTNGHGDGKVVITLTNNAGQWASDVTFKVYNPDQTSTYSSPTVSTGQTKQVTFNGLADGSHFVKITSGSSDLSQQFTIDCDAPVPSSSVTPSCANGVGQVVVTLTNSGGEAVVFDVTSPTTNLIEHVTVGADSSTTRTYSGLADGDYTVTIKVGAADLSKSFTIDCDHPLPKVTSSVVCDAGHDGSVTITFANEGTEAVVFQVTDPNTNIVENVTVAAGASTTRTFGGFVDGVHSVSVAAGGQDFTQSFTIHCDLEPSYSLDQTCVVGDGVVEVTLVNNGDDVDAVFVLDGTTYTVAPGGSELVSLGGLGDGSHDIPLTVNGDDQTFTVVIDCDRPGQPAADVVHNCVDEDGSVVVTLRNIGGQLPLTFIVEGVAHQVPANSSVPVAIDGLVDGQRVIDITQGANDFSQTVDISCDLPPSVDYTQSCVEGENGHSDGQIVVTLHNNGDDASVVFTVDGDQHTVGPKASQQVAIGGLSDGDHHVAITAGSHDLSFDVTGIACDHPGKGSLSVEAGCADNDGVISITLIATGGEQAVIFTVNGKQHPVQPDSTEIVTISGLNDRTAHVEVLAGQTDLSFDRDISCDAAPKVSYTQACSNFDDTVTVVLENAGDDVPVTFTVNGIDHTLAPGASFQVLVEHLTDGANTVNVSINGVAQPPFEVTSDCDPVFGVAPVCNSVDVNGAAIQYWFTITNTEASDVSVAWDGGNATVPAGQSINVASSSAPLVLSHDGVEIARSAAAEASCQRDVTVTKTLLGQPQASETYTIRVSRLVGDAYVVVTTFDLAAGESTTIHLASTLDPAGIDYKIEEIAAGSASTSVVSPDALKLSGHLGETVNVVVTNGYASVQIDKASSTASVLPGGQVTYTLQATNTGGLTLDPVVVTDRLPSSMEVVTASVAGAGGQCTLAQPARPQLLSCVMGAALAPGATSALITVVAKVDDTVAAGTTIVNRAMVHGAFTAVEGLVEKVITAGAAGGDLSCVPVISGSVCDLSAQVGTPVAQVAVEPPTGVSSTPVAQLPRTGAASLKTMLALGFSAVLLGGVLLLSRRRVAR